MKKSEIAFIRLMSLAAIIAINFCLLVFIAGGNVFQNIVNNFNSNAYGMDKEWTSIYNLYYYMGLNNIYIILFSVTIFVMAVAAVSVVFRVRGAGTAAFAANVCSGITAFFLLMARIYESSVGMHKFIASLYMDFAGAENIVTAQLMPKIPVVYIVMILLSFLGLVMVKSSGIMRMKVYKGKSRDNCLIYMMPGLYGFLMLEIIRNAVISLRVHQAGPQTVSIYEYIRDYYIGNKAFFNWSWAILFLIAACLAIVLKSGGKKWVRIVAVLLPGALTCILSILYILNPPPLFGYLTVDTRMCDLIEGTFYAYLVRFSLSVILGCVLTSIVINNAAMIQSCWFCMACNAVVGVTALIFTAGRSALAAYYACALVDGLTLAALVVIYVIKSTRKGRQKE